MNTFLAQHAELIDRLGWTLVHSLWEIVTIGAALVLSRVLFRSPNSRYLLAMLAMALCIVAPVATFVCLAPVAVKPLRRAPALIPSLVMAGESAPIMAPTREVVVPVKVSHVVVPSVDWRLRLRHGLPRAVAGWLAGIGFIMLRHLGGLWSVRVLRTRGLMAVSQDVEEMFGQTKLRLGLRRATRVFESARVLTPMVVGTLKPVVLLPASVLTGLAPCQLEALLAHELAHLRRWDDLANLLQCVIETLLFYHPILWWISRVAREERELCCDDLAIAQGVERHDLAHALGHIALWQTAVLQPALAATGHMPVLARIKRLLQPPVPAVGLSPWPLVAIALLMGVFLFTASQTKAEAKPSRGRILDRNGLVLAESDAGGVRRYPYQSLAAHVIGYTGRPLPGSKELPGRKGIELAEEQTLRSEGDVMLTLDARLQQIAESALVNAGCRGACVLINPNDGDILAMASVPSYDLNSMIPLVSEHVEELIKDPGTPLLARAYQGVYFPASTFKLVTALAGLRSGAIDETTMFEGPNAFPIGDRVFHNWNKESEGMLNIEGAIKRSCNTWFYQAGLKTGSGPILDMAAQLGFGQPAGLPIPEAKLSLPSDASYMQRYGYNVTPGMVASISVGQIVEVSPLQVAVAAAAFANGGKVWTPRLLLSQPASRLKNNLLDHGVKPEHLDLIKKAMVAVVNAEDGTGHRAQVPGIVVAGKTGTAQWKIYPDESKNRNLAWFTGFAPADHPRLAFALVYEGKPGESVSGGAVCGPMVKAIIEQSLAVLDGKMYEVRPQPAPKAARGSGSSKAPDNRGA